MDTVGAMRDYPASQRRADCLEWEASADVAQLVEQLIRNQQVNGSSPFVGSTIHAPREISRGVLLSSLRYLSRA